MRADADLEYLGLLHLGGFRDGVGPALSWPACRQHDHRRSVVIASQSSLRGCLGRMAALLARVPEVFLNRRRESDGRYAKATPLERVARIAHIIVSGRYRRRCERGHPRSASSVVPGESLSWLPGGSEWEPARAAGPAVLITCALKIRTQTLSFLWPSTCGSAGTPLSSLPWSDPLLAVRDAELRV